MGNEPNMVSIRPGLRDPVNSLSEAVIHMKMPVSHTPWPDGHILLTTYENAALEVDEFAEPRLEVVDD